METAGIGEHFVVTYFVSFFLAFVIAAIISRIPPISRKKDEFYNGRVQTEEEKQEAKLKFGPLMCIRVKFKELIIVFLERTFIAMPLAALFMHLLF